MCANIRCLFERLSDYRGVRLQRFAILGLVYIHVHRGIY